MKKLILAALGVVTLSATSIGVSHAATEPLVQPVQSMYFQENVRQINPIDHDVQKELNLFADAWVKDNTKTIDGQAEGAKLFKHYLKGRLEFYKDAHNWISPEDKKLIGHENLEPSYGYVHMAELVKALNKAVDADVRVNSRDIDKEDLVRRINKALDEATAKTDNRELKYYMQDLVWFAAWASVRDMNKHMVK